jgi:ADP-ribose pyrophosphatase YjhB (NUDIX family)
MHARSVGVFVVVLMKPDKVLLLRRKNTGLHDGEFSVPGGKRNIKEPWTQAAARELFEETGLRVGGNTLQKLDRVEGTDSDGTEWIGIIYLAELAEAWYGQLQKKKEEDKHDMLGWYSVNNLPKNLIPCLRKVFANLECKIPSSGSDRVKLL